MARNKFSLFKRGDVIRTNPQEGFYGIAVVLDDGRKLELSPNKWSYPMCHIAITPLIYDFEVTMKDVDLSQIYPMKYTRCYQLKNIPDFFKEEFISTYLHHSKCCPITDYWEYGPLKYLKRICLGSQSRIDFIFVVILKNT